VAHIQSNIFASQAGEVAAPMVVAVEEQADIAPRLDSA
jgi:hypothetical protein